MTRGSSLKFIVSCFIWYFYFYWGMWVNKSSLKRFSGCFFVFFCVEIIGFVCFCWFAIRDVFYYSVGLWGKVVESVG